MRKPRSTTSTTLSIDDDVSAEGERLTRAEAVVGYTFTQRQHLLTALTHSSWKNERATDVGHNEVLELLGDAVLSVVVVDELVRTSDGAQEGELTERGAAHVSADALARVAAASGLDSLLRTGRGLAADRPPNVIADVVEAVIGAVWLDAAPDGLSACRAVVQRLLGPPPAAATEAKMHAKRALQERLQRLFGKAPDYRVVRGDGPNHAPSYMAEVCFNDTVVGSGSGTNKRTATEAAAAAAVSAFADVSDDTLRERLL